MAEDQLTRWVRQHNEHLRIKQPWNTHYQSLAEVFFTRKRDFESTISPGEFLQDDIFSNVGQFAGFLHASVSVSMLWPDAARTFTLDPVRQIKDFPGVVEWFRQVTEDMQMTADAPRAGLTLAFMEHHADRGVFGTSGVGAFENPDLDDEEAPTLFEAWDIKSMCIAENSQGFVNEIYLLQQKTVRQVVEEYGNTGKVSPKVLELYKEQKYEEKVDVLKIIEPKRADLTKKGIAAMRVRTVHIDKTNKFLMRESGYADMPVFVSRMFKTKGEPYGRSSGMLALPDMLSLNVLSESILVATEKKLDPPLGVLDNGRLGSGSINTSAGAINVFDASGRIDGSGNPIFPLFTVDDLLQAKEHKEELKQSVMQAFFLDRLLDLNNQTQMTAYETSVRDRLRGEAMGSVFGREISEVNTPLIKRHFKVCYDRQRFGAIPGVDPRNSKWNNVLGGAGKRMVVPDVVAKAIAQGLQVFDINYISPAKRFMQGEKLQGLMTATDIILALDAVMPGIKDSVNPDRFAEAVYKYSGAPAETKRTPRELEQYRAAQADRAQAEDMLDAAKSASESARNVAQARATMGTTGGGQK